MTAVYCRSQYLLTLASFTQGEFFPELKQKGPVIKELLDEEEVSFSRTLDRGEKLFETYAAKAKEEGRTELNGRDVWRLYDTYGFPVDLTLLMAEENGLSINQKEFEEAQAASKEASKGAAKTGASQSVKLDVHALAELEKMTTVPKTDDLAKYGEHSNRHFPVVFALNFCRAWHIRGQHQGYFPCRQVLEVLE